MIPNDWLFKADILLPKLVDDGDNDAINNSNITEPLACAEHYGLSPCFLIWFSATLWEKYNCLWLFSK